MKLPRANSFPLAALLFVLVPASLFSGEPTERVRLAVSRGIEVVTDPRLKGREKERNDLLREIVYPIFDFEEMAKRSLGPQWNKLNPAEQKEFVAVFRDLLEKTYAERVDLYNGQEAIFLRELVEQNYAQVDSKVIYKSGEEYSVVYKLQRADGTWKVYDVVIENVSLISSYRSQFQRVIVNSSFSELIRRMKAKLD